MLSRVEERVEKEHQQMAESLEVSARPLACRPCVSVNTLAPSSPSPPLNLSSKEVWEKAGSLEEMEDSGIANSLDPLPTTHTISSRGPN